MFAALATPEMCQQILIDLGKTAALFGGILAVLGALEFGILRRWRPTPPCARVRALDLSLVVDVLCWAFPITAGTLALSATCSAAAEACGWSLPKQNIMQALQPGFFPDYIRLALAAFALFEAPLLEEGIFRRFLFRNMLRSDGSGFWPAALISGILFSAAHFNLLTCIPLAFFGAAMAWAYHRTGRIIVPMLLHFLFNLTNLLLLFIFPEMA